MNDPTKGASVLALEPVARPGWAPGVPKGRVLNGPKPMGGPYTGCGVLAEPECVLNVHRQGKPMTKGRCWPGGDRADGGWINGWLNPKDSQRVVVWPLSRKWLVIWPCQWPEIRNLWRVWGGQTHNHTKGRGTPYQESMNTKPHCITHPPHMICLT